jgi:hypothetical protein
MPTTELTTALALAVAEREQQATGTSALGVMWLTRDGYFFGLLLSQPNNLVCRCRELFFRSLPIGTMISPMSCSNSDFREIARLVRLQEGMAIFVTRLLVLTFIMGVQ